MPRRLRPSEVPSDAVERILPRRHIELEAGDVVIARERLPRVNPRAISKQPEWRYRVSVHRTSESYQFFTSFAHAAAGAEQIASSRKARVMFVEDDIPSLVADYRRK